MIKRVILSIILLINVVNFSFAPTIFKENEVLKTIRIEYEVNCIKTNNIINDKILYEYLILKNVDPDFAYIITKQAVLESFWFKSSLFKRSNNAFGMGYPTKRFTFAIGKTKVEDGNIAAVYSTIWDSIDDYLLWIYSSNYVNSDYYSYLEHRGYCPSKEYSLLLKSIKLTFKN